MIKVVLICLFLFIGMDAVQAEWEFNPYGVTEEQMLAKTRMMRQQEEAHRNAWWYWESNPNASGPGELPVVYGFGYFLTICLGISLMFSMLIKHTWDGYEVERLLMHLGLEPLILGFSLYFYVVGFEATLKTLWYFARNTAIAIIVPAIISYIVGRIVDYRRHQNWVNAPY